MADLLNINISRIAKEIGLQPGQVQNTVDLLDAGNTIPFITRYRRDQTGGLDEEQIQRIQVAVEKARSLEQRKQTILRSIESQGKLTEELATEIRRAETTKRLEDLYLPFRPKKQTLATQARERGLQPLADEILRADPICSDLDRRAADFVNPDKELPGISEVLLGAGYILAERFSERADLRQKVRKIYRRSGKLVSSKIEGVAEKVASQFHDFHDYREPLGRAPAHRVLAINRGERAKVLRVKVEAALEPIERTALELLVPVDHPHVEFVRGCVSDSLTRLVLPSLEREARRELTEKSETHAVEVFAKNLSNLLLQPPVRGRRVLAVDPGFKNGCKLAALAEDGQVLAIEKIFLVGSDERKAEARTKLIELITTHDLSVVAIGNGTACRETEELVAELIAEDLKERDVSYVVVNEAGASVYSTSALGREELPDYDAMQRSAVSIGRRLQDPLSELVKIDPASIGVGLYQHDAKGKQLSSSLDGVVQSCVSRVGVNLNTASPALLRYVSGLNQLTARRLYEYRTEKGPFKRREQISEVPGLGEATFVQAAGFLKIEDGDNPLDATWIHPESYDAAQKLLEKFEIPTDDVRKPEARAKLSEEASQQDATTLADEFGVGQLLLKDMLEALAKPGHDPREDLSPPVFRRGIVKLDDLVEGMDLTGTVLNVVDFGAFVDVGLSDSGLVHVSQLANRFVRDPHEVVSVGDTVEVWVTGIDKDRRRVALTMIKPGTEVKPEPKPKRPPRKRKPTAEKRPEASKRQGKPQGGSARGGRSGARPSRPKKKAKPLVPITDDMITGAEPMRTFGDLLQFQQKKSPQDKPKQDQAKNDSPKDAPAGDKPVESADE